LGRAGVFSENFDSVTAPALPAGWTTSASGVQTPWVTTALTNFSAPNAAFSIDATNVGINELDTPAIVLPAVPGQLTFHHDYNLEASTSTSAGYDGGVLEIKIGAGSYADILAAGGSFVSGGYTRTISTNYGNPLGGRQAWSGNSGGFITSIVNLPAAAAGQTIQLRWRCGTDNGVGLTGWFLDNIAIGGLSCCSNAPAITTQPQNKTVVAGASATFSVSAIGTAPLTYQWRFNGTNLTGATASTYTRSNAQLATAGNYNVIVSNVLGSATSAVANLAIVNAPLLVSAHLAADHSFSFTVSGDIGFNYVIEGSTNLSNWLTVTTLSNATGQTIFADTNTSAFPARFYRARLLP
jgi:hypothetical protein